ncbi:phosphate/phosphite/phosphonate ABC transporter substrate-binding protein [Rhizobium oryziradicis]|uniref:Phosphate ABC transporter substrate-binding protein n=1 Tax=Rhizobium oryziradicis TaxID=1867956 RepID=A0A1Q8ZKR8_9HYPH|nr:PhnD/SsuA/transferrin family substrate-binding protein [Rhizobium oryziradicis]OLP42494.1 phosphate ABC transporter substrate-binding protein [Rhizobium oryziradicis]
MYDWPELRSETDALWASMRRRFLDHGIDAPENLVRRNADMPPVPGGIRSKDGTVIAADPATLDPDAFDLAVLWRHPGLLVANTCWGPMEFGLKDHVQVIGQSDYQGVEGGKGEFYCSAIIARKGDGEEEIAPSSVGDALLPLDFFRQKILAFNDPISLSGYLSLKRDLKALGESLEVFANRLETGAHRASVTAVARGQADIAAIDCKSWMLAQRYEPAAKELRVIGWTAHRKGLPFIRAKGISLPFGL